MRRKIIVLAVALFAGCCFLSCADTLLTADGYAGKPSTTGNSSATKVATTAIGGGVYETQVDATDYGSWVFFDFDTRAQMVVVNPANDTAWELGFQRFKIMSNGGVSGIGGTSVVAISGDNFDTRSQAPNPFSPQLTDQSDPAGDANDACRPPGVLYAFLNSTQNTCWFSYDSGTHQLLMTDKVYILKTAQPKYYKIKFLNFYSATGTSGKITFRWGEVLAP